MAFTISANMTTIDTADSTTNWSSTNTIAADTEVFVEGTASIGIVKVSQAVVTTKFDYYTANASTYYNASTSPTHLYFWVNVGNGSGLDTKAGGGLRIYMEDNVGVYNEWYVAGNDTYSGGWRCFVAYTDNPADNSNGTIDKTQIQYFGVSMDMLAKTTANVNNAWIDISRYGTGLTCYGTDVSAMTWADVLTGDEAGPYGVIRKNAGVYLVQGPISFGDTTGTNSTNFQDSSQIVIFEDAQVSSTHYAITVAGNGTGTTKFQLGNKSGTAGIQGCFLKSEGTKKFDFTATDTNITDLKLYGCTFYDADTTSLPANSATKEVLNTTFEACNEVLADTCIVKYCNFVNADDRGIRISSASHNISDCNFISCPDAIHIPSAGTYTFTNLVFTGNTYDIENSGSSTAVTINASGTTNASTSENTGTPAGTTTINNTKTLTVTVTDESAAAVEGAQVWIQKASSETSEYGHPTNPYTDPGASTNQQGDLTYVITQTIEGDNPASGWLVVTDNTNNREQNYRYASRTGSTFTLNTKVSGTCETGGSSTLLNDTGINTSVIEGDTIRNETDGSWALALSVSTNSVTTTTLQGGTSNDWATSDTWSIHSLSQNYTTGDTSTVPIMNEETNASGVATESYNFGATMAVDVRIRHTSGATKYFPYKTTGSITGDFDLTAVLIEDTIAS